MDEEKKEKLEKEVRRRGVIKGSITRIETFINKYENDNNIDVSEFSVREKFLVKAFDDYNIVQSEIEELEIEQIEDRVLVEEKYFKLHARIQSLVKNRLSCESRASGSGSEGASSRSQLPSSRSTQIHLPNLNIPTFCGKYEDWKSFLDIFNALIDSDNNLSEVQKFLYLKTALEGEPLTLIEDLKATNENYKLAFDTLKNRYDNKLSIVHSHIKTLLELPQMHRVNSTNLRDFITKVKKHVNSLKSLAIPVESWDIMLVYILSNKLDFNMHRSYELEHKAEEMPKLIDFLDFLEKGVLR